MSIAATLFQLAVHDAVRHSKMIDLKMNTLRRQTGASLEAVLAWRAWTQLKKNYFGAGRKVKST
jgi:hypothetical protein